MQQLLNDFLLTYGITPQSTTGRARSELFLKREPRTRCSLLRPDLGTKVRNKQENQANNHDRVKFQNLEFKDEIVSARDYLGPRKWKEGRIVKRLGR